MREYLKTKYTKYERQIGALGLITGFIFDWLTLRRVDLWRENLWLITLLFIAALGILTLNYYYRRQPTARAGYQPHSFHFWLIFIIQFSFGGLLSSFLVLYFRSAVLAVAWPFLSLLLAVFVGNEIFKERYAQMSYQIGVLFLAVFAFAIFAVPVLTHRLGYPIFLLSGLISLAFMAGFGFLLRLVDPAYYLVNRRLLTAIVLGIFVLINGLYFTNLIPPIPLSLKAVGIYHQVIRRPGGNYDALAETGHWSDLLRWYQPVSWRAGQPLYAYSAVFSPTKLNIAVVHKWERYLEATGEWVAAGRVILPIIGGRDGGYRTYSYRSGLAVGRWRVNVETERGQLIGRIKFKVTTGQPQTEWQVLD